MNAKANTKRVGALATAAAIAAIAIPTASATGSGSDPGLVARKLGSPDPREQVTRSQYAPGQIASRLGSPDPRESALASGTASVIASRLGSPDPRDTADVELLNGNAPAASEHVAHLNSATYESNTALDSAAPSAVASDLGSPDPQDSAIVAQSASPVTGSGFDWSDFGIGLGFGIGLSAILAGTAILVSVAFRGRSVAQPLV